MGRARPRGWHRTRVDLGEEESALFPLGAEVEVRSDDLGFVGSFYEATIAGYHPSGRGYVVAYSTLTRREDGGSPLQEHAAAEDVRPRPPAPHADEPPRNFAMHEMVEAFHNEGWWAGVICAVPPEVMALAGDGERRPRRVYTVCFPTSREVLEFEETALRPRRLFRGERWVPAAEAANESPMFREGRQVEVSGSAKTYGEYWNPAIVQKVIGATSFLVQYRHVREHGELTTEILDSQYIRPARNIILMDSKYRFPPSSHVEVFHEVSWWPGVILEVLDDKYIKKYVVKIKSRETDLDDVEYADVLTVEHTQLRPHYDWDGKKWVRHLTEKPVNIRPPLNSRKRPISAALASGNGIDEIPALASCNDSEKIAAFASCNDSDKIRDTTGSYLNKKVKNADVILGPVCPDLSVCNENENVQPKTSSYLEEAVKKQNSVLALKSPLTLPSQLSVTGFGHLKYDPKLCLSSQLQLSSPPMIAMPSIPQTGKFQASLFGAFGQLRPLPQGPVLGIQSLNPDFGNIGGSKRAFTDQEKHSADKVYYLMPGAEQNISAGSFIGTDVSRKRKECASFPTRETREGLRQNPEIMLTRKRIVDKNVEETSKSVAISEEPTKSKNDGDNELPYDATPGSGVLSETNTVTSIDPTPLKDNKGSQERSVFLRESSIIDEIIPSGIPIGTDELQQGGYIGALRSGAIKVSVLIENSVLSVTSTFDKPGDANVFPSDSSTQFGNKETVAGKSAIIMEKNIRDEFFQQSLVIADDANVDLLPSAESCGTTGDDRQLCTDSMEAMVKCVTSGDVRTENVSSMSLGVFSGVAQNLFTSSENCEANKEDGMGRADHQGNTSNMLEIEHASADGDIIMTQSSTKKFSANEQHGVSQQNHSSPMVEYAAESSQSMDKLTLTQLSSVDMSNSTEAEHGNRLTVPKDDEITPMSKYIPSRTHDCCHPLLQRSLVIRENIIADQPSESLGVENLPFVKTSLMWAQIEAMEIFSKVLQRPSFHQFQLHVPELREGMALGLMLSFASLAESIKRLNIQDENSLFEEKMKGVSTLEAHGFDVSHLRSRLETLLHIKNGCAELQDAIKKLQEKIAHKEIDDCQLGAQIGMLNTTICQLDLHASLFRCIMQSAVSQKINHTLEISMLKTEASELERSFLSAEQRFRSVVAAPW